MTELLEGETLRTRLSGGAIAVRKAIDYAVQMAKGLAAAHEKGIVHRDLKPENLFLTSDGRVKILDFGLAKLTQAEAQSGPQTNMPTATEPGVVMGTLGYMSPEQVKGKSADQRSDLFAFGAILYEMLSGIRAFHRDSAAETMSAILREEPPDLSATNKTVQPGLERIVRHCLEKNPEERFHSARDVAFDLEALSGVSGTTAATSVAGSSGRRRRLPVIGVAAILAALAVGYVVGKGRSGTKPLAFRQLTFRRGTVWSARFGVDGKTAFYSASWDGAPTEIYVSAPGSPESRPLGIPGADVLAVSPAGDLAMALESRVSTEFTKTGTLARASATGGGAPAPDPRGSRVRGLGAERTGPRGRPNRRTARRGWSIRSARRSTRRAAGSRARASPATEAASPSSTIRSPATMAASPRSSIAPGRRRRSRLPSEAPRGSRGRRTVRRSGSRRRRWETGRSTPSRCRERCVC